MKTINAFWLLSLFALVACASETIYVRPSLDTPEQHTGNGHILLDQKKWAAACREFERARELDPQYTEAYIGLGLAYAGGGDVEKGLRMLHKAEKMARTDEQRAAVRDALDRIQPQ